MREVGIQPPTANPFAWKALIVIFGVLGFLFIAVVTALGGGIFLAAGLFGLLGLIFLGPWLISIWKPNKDGLFWTAIGLSLFAQGASTFSPVSFEWVMQVWFAGVCLLMLPHLIRSLQYRIIAVYIGLFSVYVVLGLISSRLSGSHRLPALVQLAYNFKLPIGLMLGVCTVWSQTTEHQFWRFLRVLMWVLLAVAAFELLLPGIFYKLARGAKEAPELDQARNPFFANKIRRVISIFRHSGVLAYYCSLFSLLITAKLLNSRDRLDRSILLTLFGFVFLLLLSGQRQETATTIFCMLVLLLIVKTRPSFPAFMLAGFIVIMAGAGIYMLSDTAPIQNLMESWGLKPSVLAQDEARPVFYADSFKLANGHWPLGVGLGRFGGYAALNYDQSLYLQLGYGRYWWYRAGLYMLDTFWPTYIAESGWIGAISVMLGGALLVIYSFFKAWSLDDPGRKLQWSFAFAAQFMLLGISLTSSSYGDPKSMLIPMIFLGLALRKDRAKSAVT